MLNFRDAREILLIGCGGRILLLRLGWSGRLGVTS
jgi:hypothetical protein